MRRTNIYLDDTQLTALDRLAGLRGTSRAEIVRQFIELGLERGGRGVDDDVAAIRLSFGTLASDDIDAPDRHGGDRQRHLDRILSP